MMELAFGLVGVAGFVLAVLGELRARRSDSAAARELLSGAGAAIAEELAVLSGLSEANREGGTGGARRRGASLARLCALCERAENLKAGLGGAGRLPETAAHHLDGLLADADRALREAGRGDAPMPGLAPWRAEKLAAALRAF